MDAMVPFHIPKADLARMDLFDVRCTIDELEGMNVRALLTEGEPWPMGWPVARIRGSELRFVTTKTSGTAAVIASSGDVVWVSWSTLPKAACGVAPPDANVAALRDVSHPLEVVTACGQLVSLGAQGTGWMLYSLSSACESGQFVLETNPTQTYPVVTGMSGVPKLQNHVGLMLYFVLITPRSIGDGVRSGQVKQFLEARQALENRLETVEVR